MLNFGDHKKVIKVAPKPKFRNRTCFGDFRARDEKDGDLKIRKSCKKLKSRSQKKIPKVQLLTFLMAALKFVIKPIRSEDYFWVKECRGSSFEEFRVFPEMTMILVGPTSTVSWVVLLL